MTVRAAILGLGSWGRVLVDSASAVDGLSIVSAVARNPSSHSAFADQHRLKVVAHMDDVLHSEIDAIIIATPHSRHFDDAVRALEAGKHVFVEKPFALRTRDAIAMIDAAKRQQLVLAAGHNRRFLPAIIEIRRLVADGCFGHLLHAEAHMSGPTSDGYLGSWRSVSSESPLGGLAGAGIHLIDLMIDLLGPVERVAAIGTRQVVALDMEDTTVVILGFRTGQAGCISTLTVTPPLFRFRLVGTNLIAEFSDEPMLRLIERDGTIKEIAMPSDDGVISELQAFAAAVRGQGVAYPIPLEEVLHGIEVFETIVAAAETGSFLPIQTEYPDYSYTEGST